MSKLPTPVPGSLGKYSTADAPRTRHIALNKSVSKHGYKTTVLDLNLRATLNKNQAPDASQTMREDIDYLRNKYRPGGKSRGGGSRKSRARASRKSRVRASRKSRVRASKKSKSDRARSRKSRKSRK